jgi:phage shock protein PspC (stress-responsive transcriptional regulator)
MNRIISMKLGRQVFQIEEDAYDHLHRYLDRLRANLSPEDDRNEIIDDIESRMAELFLLRMGGNKQHIDMGDVQEVLSVMGDPADIGEGTAPGEETTATRGPRRLFRHPDDRMISGICGGMGAYFNVEAIWFRILFLILLIFLGGGFFLYLVLTFIIPVAKTPAERLMMHGEDVNLRNLERRLKEEGRAMGENIRNSYEKAKRGEGMHSIVQAFTKILTLVVQLLAGITGVLLIVIAATLLISLFFGDVHLAGGGLELHGIETLGRIFNSQSTFSAVQILLPIAIALPILMAGVRILSRLSGQTLNRYVGISTGTLSAIAFGALLIIGMSTARSFRSTGEARSQELLPSTDTLEINTDFGAYPGLASFGFSQERFRKPDGIYLHNTRLEVAQSPDSQFHLLIFKTAAGSDMQDAEKTAEKIQLAHQLTGNVLTLNNNIVLPADEKFRNQQIRYVLQVPLGRYVRFNRNLRHVLSQVANTEGHYAAYFAGRLALMGPSGLQCIACDGPLESQGGLITETGAFSGIEIHHGIDVEITAAQAYRLRSQETPEALGITWEVVNGVLKISRSSQFNTMNDDEAEPLQIEIPQQLHVLKLSGAARARLHNIKSNSLRIQASGASRFNGNVQATELFIDVSGASRGSLSGNAEKLDAELSGASDLDAFALLCNDVHIDAAGASTAVVQAHGHAKANASGASRIKIAGNGTLESKTGGGSSVDKI